MPTQSSIDRQARFHSELSDAIISRDPDTVRSVLVAFHYKPNRTDLSLAMRYGSAEIVTALLDRGTSFPEDHKTPYERVLERRKLKPTLVEALFPYPHRPQDADRTLLDDSQRIAIADLLVDRQLVYPEYLLLYAGLHGDVAVAYHLMDRGISSAINLRSQAFYYRDGEMNALASIIADECPAQVGGMLQVFGRLARKKLPFYSSVYYVNEREQILQPHLCAPESFEAAFNCTTLAEHATRKTLFLGLVKAHNEAGVRMLLDNGFIKRRDMIESFIGTIQSLYPKELGILTLLLDRLREIEAKRPTKNLFSLDADPNSVAFLKESWNYKALSNGTLMITGYKGKATEVIVPERIGKRAVSAIGEYAFSPKANRLTEDRKAVREALVSVEIPDCVKFLDTDLFNGCTNLEHVRLPADLKAIPNRTFENAHSLKTFELSPNITRIGFAAFWYTDLQEMFLPDTVTEVETAAFQGSNIKKISVLASALLPPPKHAWRPFGPFMSCTQLTEVELRGSSGNIPDFAFANCMDLKSLTIPDGIQNIGDNAFFNSGLVTCIVPSSVQEVGAFAFADCLYLQEVSFEGPDTQLQMGTFYDSRSLEDVKLPSKLRSLPDRTFERCSRLNPPYIPPTVRYVGQYAFGKTPIKRNMLPKSTLSISDRAFRVGPKL